MEHSDGTFLEWDSLCRGTFWEWDVSRVGPLVMGSFESGTFQELDLLYICAPIGGTLRHVKNLSGL